MRITTVLLLCLASTTAWKNFQVSKSTLLRKNRLVSSQGAPQSLRSSNDNDFSSSNDNATLPLNHTTPSTEAEEATTQEEASSRPNQPPSSYPGLLVIDFGRTVPNVQLQITPTSLMSLFKCSFLGMSHLGTALLGSLRWLAPLIVARRGLNYVGDIILDWYRGRYFRTTYLSIDYYWKYYYQIPAALRSLGRIVAQLLLLMTLGRIMEWMVGLDHVPCVILKDGNSGCHWWCGLLWMVSVVGTGHAGAGAIAVWGGPLRIQTAIDTTQLRRPKAKQIFTQPWNALQWLRDPDQWIREIAKRDSPLKPFHPDPLLFPATWEPLRVLQMFALAREMTHDTRLMHSIMRQVLIQQSFGDEWYRALMCEKRVALGIVVMAGYLLSSLGLLWTTAKVNTFSTALMLPYLSSIIISGWMNIFVYHDRRQAVRQGVFRPNSEFFLPGKVVVKTMQW